MVALAGITIKVMPESVEVDLEALKNKGQDMIKEIYGDVKEIKVEEEPIAFGLKALNFTFIVEETLGSDVAIEGFNKFEEVASSQCTGFQRLT